MNNGKNRGDDDYFLEYKAAKRKFKNEMKKAEYEYEIQSMKDVCYTNEIDTRYFWHLVNKQKTRKSASIHPLKIDEETRITQPEEICNTWKEYFQSLYTPQQNKHFDTHFKEEIERDVDEMDSLTTKIVDDIMEEPISQKEIDNIIGDLKLRKAPGWDNITGEQVKYGGKMLAKCLMLLFNLITKIEYIPQNFKMGIIIPIPKGTKDQLLRDNYRGITLLPVIGKVYEKVIYYRMTEWAQRQNLLHNLQGAERKYCSSINTAWLIQEAIHNTLEERIYSLDYLIPYGKNVYCTNYTKQVSKENVGGL